MEHLESGSENGIDQSRDQVIVVILTSLEVFYQILPSYKSMYAPTHQEIASLIIESLKTSRSIVYSEQRLETKKLLAF